MAEEILYCDALLSGILLLHCWVGNSLNTRVLVRQGRVLAESVTSCRQRCQQFGTFCAGLQIFEVIFGIFPSVPLRFFTALFGLQSACFSSFHGTSNQECQCFANVPTRPAPIGFDT